MVKAIIFDYDDTLVQTMASKWDALKETGRRFYGLTITDDDIKQFWGKPFREMLEGVLKQADSFENLRRAYETVHPEYPMKAHEDAPRVVAELLRRYKVGIVTASNRKLVTADLAMLGFPIEAMAYIQTSEDTDVHKPDPRVFDPIVRHLAEQQIHPDEIVYVGDDLKDYAAAQGAGLQFYGVTYGTAGRAAFETHGAKTIDRLSELLTLSL